MSALAGTQAQQPGPEAPHEALMRLLREDRRNLTWLSEMLKERTGWTRSISHLYRVGIGERPISEDLAQRLAVVFGVPIETFLAAKEGAA